MSRKLNKLCVFCGSSPGSNSAYSIAAVRLGQEIASRKIGLVYGGGSLGVMGKIANTVLEWGGEVTGVVPHFFIKQEVVHHGLTDLQVVSSMHERKARMVEISDGFIALPGGLGTVEEFFEVLTWAQLGIHHKPCGLLNVDGYFDSLIEFINYATGESFVSQSHRALLQVDVEPVALLDKFAEYRAPQMDKSEWAKSFTS